MPAIFFSTAFIAGMARSYDFLLISGENSHLRH